MLALVFGLGWGLAMGIIDDKPLLFWLVAGAFAGVLYAVGMTLWMAWKMTDGGREPMRVPKLRDATTVTTAETLVEVQARVDRKLFELGVTPTFVDEPNGFRASGESWWRSSKIGVVVRDHGGVRHVDIRSEPAWPWQVLDLAGKNEANVKQIAEAVASSTQPVGATNAAARASRPQATHETP
ncbi:MAG: hypothetical protein AAF211_29960 [Myxococcota bacterium]